MKDIDLARVVTTVDEEETAAILAKIDATEHLLRASTEESEKIGRLAASAIAVLREIGTLTMRLPRELGGSDLSLTGQMRVLTRLAEIDSASAWCSMVINNATSILGTSVGAAGFEIVYGGTGGVLAAGVAAPDGSARPVDGGYLVNGSWRFCSGIYMADWVICRTFVDADPAQVIGIAVPVDDVTIHDTWNVVGLRGTGSNDFSLESVFVPHALVMPDEPQRHGARAYPQAQGDEHIAIGLGLAKRSLRDIETGFRDGLFKWADREVVQAELSRLSLQVDAAGVASRALFVSLDLMGDQVLDHELGLRVKAMGTYVTELAVSCAAFAMRRGGGRALYLPNSIERNLRDATAAQAHVLVSDQNFASHGAALLGVAPVLESV